ncbi:MAG: hypothetical protein ABIH63_03610 [archaeon]
MYREVFWKSIRNLRLSLFIPDLYLLLVEMVLAFLFFKFTGLAALLTDPVFVAASIEDKIPLLRLFISENTLGLLIYFLIFVLTSFILGASLNSMRYGMIRDVVFGDRYSFKQVMNYGVRFWPIVVVRLIIFVFGIVTFLFVLGCYSILETYYPIPVTLFIVTFLVVAAILFLKFLFLFTYAIMFLDHKGALASVINSFAYFLRNKWYVFKVFLLILVLSAVLLPFELIFNYYQNALGLLSFYTILFFVVRGAASAFYNVWSEVLIFYSYAARLLFPSGPSQL